MANLKVIIKGAVCLIPVLISADVISSTEIMLEWEYDPNTIVGAYTDLVVEVHYEDVANSTWADFPEQFSYTDNSGKIDYSFLTGIYETVNIRISVTNRDCSNFSNTINVDIV